MKKSKLLIAALCLASTATIHAQNTFPFPASGNVGIGTTTPVDKLDIAGGDWSGIYLRNQANGGGGTLKWAPSGVYGSGRFLVLSNETSNTLGTGTDGGLLFRVNQGPSEGYTNPAVAILQSGYVGIGTLTPEARLDVAGNVRFPTFDIHADNGATADRPYIRGAGNHLVIAPATVGGTMYISYPGDLSGTVSTRIQETIYISETGPGGHGNVGIGTDTPEQKLHISGGRLQVNTAAAWDNFQIYTDGTHSYLEANGDEDGLWIRSNVGQKVIIPTANVGIGTTSPSEKLSVNGKIRAKEVIVETAGWSDYVFADDYKLTSLADVEAQIKTNKHLPGVPSAQEVAEKGVSVGDMQALLLAKIEELTLHQIAQEKRTAAQDTKLEAQAAKIAVLETENAQLRH